MKHRTAATIQQPRETAELRSNLPAGERTEGARLSSDDLSPEVDPLAAAPDGSMAVGAWAGLDFPDLAHHTLTSEDVDVHDLSEPEGLVGINSAEFEEAQETVGVVDLVPIYLQEAGAIPLLTPADETRWSILLQNARARLVEILRGGYRSVQKLGHPRPRGGGPSVFGKSKQRLAVSIMMWLGCSGTVGCPVHSCASCGPNCSPGSRH